MIEAEVVFNYKDDYVIIFKEDGEWKLNMVEKSFNVSPKFLIFVKKFIEEHDLEIYDLCCIYFNDNGGYDVCYLD